MNRKLKFMQAVQILAPNDPFILQAAEKVRNHPWALRVYGAAVDAAREMNEMTVQA
jgi:hypothetical protein